jgi:hypothetical protein
MAAPTAATPDALVMVEVPAVAVRAAPGAERLDALVMVEVPAVADSAAPGAATPAELVTFMLPAVAVSAAPATTEDALRTETPAPVLADALGAESEVPTGVHVSTSSEYGYHPA